MSEIKYTRVSCKIDKRNRDVLADEAKRRRLEVAGLYAMLLENKAEQIVRKRMVEKANKQGE